MVEISSGKYLCWIALKRWWFFCSRWLLNRCAGSIYAILMIMFPSLGLELSGAKGLILTALIKPDWAFLCNFTLHFWLNDIAGIREENRIKKMVNSISIASVHFWKQLGDYSKGKCLLLISLLCMGSFCTKMNYEIKV